jgi:hypothetical protein
MNLNSILSVLAATNNANEIGKQFNVESEKVTQVITAALPTLIGAMQKNAATESGASSLSQALNSHLGDNTINLSNDSLIDGSKILSHILGNNSNNVFSALAKQTNTSSSQVSGILAAIAPLLLGLLGNSQKSANTGMGDLGGMLGSILGGSSKQSSGGLLGSILGGFLK